MKVLHSNAERSEAITLFPDRQITVDILIKSIGDQSPHPVLSPPRFEVLNALSKAILKDAALTKLAPWTALAYWLRRSAVTRLASDFDKRLPQGTIAAPRGCAVHLPPQNVDTIFIYSWAISFLMGNLNIVRLPARLGAHTKTAIVHLQAALADRGLEESNLFVQYPSESDVNRALFSIADLRFIWGGDAKIRALSVVPAKPNCLTLPFSDRFSFSILDCQAYDRANETERDALAASMFFDVYQFDQMACSSTRLIFWLGSQKEAAKENTKDLSQRLVVQAASRAYAIAPQTRMEKFAASNRAAIDLGVERVHDSSPHVTSVELCDLPDIREIKPGAGFLFFKHVNNASEIAAFVRRKDQTVTHFGFDADALKRIASELLVSGVDRLVPVGSALNFDVIWDGFDLMAQSSRLVKVQV
ncbi:acyl-CoA reductase [Oricola cellulosilytica]|nr:acyl-CoA reductase [Oricola cellulosilytica]